MKPALTLALTAIISGAAIHAYAADAAIKVTVDGVSDGKPVPEAYARCKPAADGKSTDGQNLQPGISWGDAPKGTKSFAVFVMDPDVPADFSDANKDGKTIAADAIRKDFFHFASVNIPAEARMIAGSSADKNPGYGTPLANDMGLNKYVPTETAYGGPCPPWNDQRIHHYHFEVLALDKDAPIQDPEPAAHSKWTPDNTAKATFNRLMGSGHVLAKGEVVGTYTLNPALRQ